MTKTLTRFASVAAATTVAGTGLVLAAASPAQADTSVWDKVAYCESTNNWSINTGNGFYGGLQFTISTWNSFGGQEFADRAEHATKAEQITVAQRVLAVQGPGAWPVCSKYAGLTKENGGASYSAPASTAVSTTKAATAAAKPASTSSTASKATTTKKATVKKATSSAEGTYTVKAGDTLWKIAQDNGISDWHSIYNLNADQIENPDLIYVGQHFVLS